MAPVPAHLAKFLAKASDPSIYNVSSRPRFPYISIGDNRFTAIDEEGRETVLGLKGFEFIVISSNPAQSKIYYATGYDPSSPGAPDCYSDNGFFPDIRVMNPMSDSCSTCRMNMWGSAKSNLTGKDIKACADAKKLAVVPFDEDGNSRGLHMFRLSPASLPNWGTYINELSRNRITDEAGLTPEFVLTRAFWGDKKNVMKFRMVDYLDENECKFAEDLREDQNYQVWIGTDNQSQARPQLAAGPRHVPQQLSGPAREEPREAEYEEVVQKGEAKAPSRKRESTAREEPKEEAPRPRGRLGGSQEFLDEGRPGAAREEMQAAGQTQGERLGAVEAAKRIAREQIANGTRR